MNNTAIALLGFTSWTLLLAFSIAMLRGFLSMKGEHQLNSYAPDGADVSPFSNRLCRAHANCLENLPLFAVIALYALVSDQTSVTDPLALVLLAARIGQSTIHIINTSVPAVMIRASFFSVQLALMGWFLINLL
ncbi:MAG: MAPEG family protein [Moraxellaceae bacterium]|nr:MAG: MAPEG family protein [Moraxellaceae bacterium]